ncbi:endonuclease V [Halobacteriales archaeon QS_4_69_225]|nr:MAG: endonuclease V [Halobacteriales archaeon QS_4_69_225]
MELVRDRFRPDGSRSREEMEATQHDVAAAATFADDADVGPAAVRSGEAVVAGVDQAFLDERVVSAVVALRGDEVIARASAVTPLSIPYIPGLLTFREGEPMLAALENLDVEPDVLVLDGSGRIHYREAGIATHVGVCFDVPAVGVAKSLLCGRPREPVDALSEGARVPIETDDSMTAPDGEVVGYAYQSRQYPNSTTINPLYVSPGHRLSAATAVDVVAATGGEYKLPRPTRLADAYADELTDDV